MKVALSSFLPKVLLLPLVSCQLRKWLRKETNASTMESFNELRVDGENYAISSTNLSAEEYNWVVSCATVDTRCSVSLVDSTGD